MRALGVPRGTGSMQWRQNRGNMKEALKGVGRPRDGRIDRDVLLVTENMCLTGSYSNLSLNEISKRAGTTRRAISRRWPSKAHLVVDAFIQHSSGRPVPDTGSFRGDLVSLVHQYADLFNSPDHRGMALAGMAALGDLGLEYGGIPQARLPAVRSIFERATERGERLDGLLPAPVAQLLVGGVLYRSVVLQQPVDDAAVDAFIDTILSAPVG